uniref:Tetratricopeptide repeat protein n=1 Tax=Oscillatoriales cyanobacterium SpSt-418 TaxID=2282169 RepID=A0A7C3KCY0_9CYAN
MQNQQLNGSAIANFIANWLDRFGQLKNFQSLFKKVFIPTLTWLYQLQTKLSPQNPHALHKLAKAWLQQENWETACRTAQAAIALDPSVAWFHQTLGEAATGLGKWQLAEQSYQQAIALDPNVAWFHFGLAKAHIAQENWQPAISAGQQAVILEPDGFWFHYTLGEALVKGGEWETALPILQKAVQLQPSFPWTYYHLGDALLALEQVDDAIASYQKSVDLRPNNDYLVQNLEYAQHIRHQWQKLTDYCDRMRHKLSGDGTPLKILMITPYLPYPPASGALARMFHELKALSAQHHVVLASLMFAREEYAYETDLEQYCDLAITVPLGDAPPRQTDEPKIVNRYSSIRFRLVLKALQDVGFDIVTYNFVYAGQYAEFFPQAFNVLNEHNIESELLKRTAELQKEKSNINQLAQQTDAVRSFLESELDAKLLAAYEDQIWPTFPLRTVVSDRDRQILDSRCTQGKTLVVQNGIDTQSVQLLPSRTNKTLIFIGTLNYYPNIDGACYLVEQIMPFVWEIDSTIQVVIAGSMPPQKVLDLARDRRVRVVPNPPNMDEVASECSLSVVPLRVGSGTRIKILHSLALGLPTISTSLGCEGLAVEDGTHLIIRDEPADFARAIAQLLNDSALQENLRQNGRQLVEQHYDWNQIYQQAEQQLVAQFAEWKATQQVRC